MMTRCPAIYDAYTMLNFPDLYTEVSVTLNGRDYVPARAHRTFSLRHRLRATWLVFTGRADALIWPGQED